MESRPAALALGLLAPGAYPAEHDPVDARRWRELSQSEDRPGTPDLDVVAVSAEGENRGRITNRRVEAEGQHQPTLGEGSLGSSA